jgi:archaellum component FlaD/FlaE
MYATPSRSPRASSKRHAIPEGPIFDFVSVVEETAAADWQRRTAAFQVLIDRIPENTHETEGGTAWYNNPATLRHLAISISVILKDARSTVVKRTCAGLKILFERCKDDARYLFKDLMPTVLSVHAQTVHVIRQTVENMVLEAIPEVHCKMVMPLWMERLRIDRSRTVRDACALYLGHSLEHWTEEGYLTDEIWFQVGRTLLGSVRDPSQSVRDYSKQVLEKIHRSHPQVFENLLNDTEGPAGKDAKLYRWLKNVGQQSIADGAEAAEDLSVASRFSYNSDIRMRAKTAAFSPSGGRRRNDEIDVPNSIGISIASSPISHKTSSTGSTGSVSRRSAGASSSYGGSPQRATPPLHQPSRKTGLSRRDEEGSAGSRSSASELIEREANDAKTGAEESFPADLNLNGWRQTIQKSVESTQSDARYEQYMKSPPERKVLSTTQASTPETPQPFQPTASTVSALGWTGNSAQAAEGENGPKISNVEALKKFSKRRSRSSLLIQERLRISSSIEDDDDNHAGSVVSQKRSDEENSMPNPAPAVHKISAKPPVFPSTKATSTPSVTAPEHMIIAIRLLKSHKDHVDTIMETLRIEMDTLRDFDKLLEEAGRPTEEEVLDYYESVGLCLEQRAAAGAKLQQELDRVSEGEPPME